MKAMLMVGWAVFVLWCVQAVHGADAATLDAGACEGLGFSSSLSCSSCALLSEYVTDRGLIEECRQCCHEDENDDNRRYDHARIELDRKFAKGLPYYYPGLFGFLRAEGSFKRFPGLHVVDKSGIRPRLQFYDQAGDASQHTSLEGWKEENIADYIESKLVDGKGKPIEEQAPSWLKQLLAWDRYA